MLKSICIKCGKPIYSAEVRKGKKQIKEWLHENYKESWRVDSQGYAENLHFAEPTKIVNEN